MSLNRVQKLLFSEYCDFEDMVLVESPFAQTTKEGRGIRQVHLGLTPTKLVIATDILPPMENSFTGYIPGVDPDIETFELIAIYPVECVNLSIYRRRKRQALKAHFCNNKVYYFELGGFEKRHMFWNLWCEKVKFLSPEESASAHSETSVATSSTNSTLYLVDTRHIVRPNGTQQIWCKFGKSQTNVVRKWTDRYLFLGEHFEEWSSNYKPIVLSPTSVSEFFKCDTTDSVIKELHVGDSIHINRFGSGIRENCSTALFLPADDYIVPRKFSQLSSQSSDPMKPKIFWEVAEKCVQRWERNTKNIYLKHRRRYGFCPQPLFLHGLGPWNISKGVRFSIQVKRTSSEINIRRPPPEREMHLPVSKRQLIATISCDNLLKDVEVNSTFNQPTNSHGQTVIFFWTPDYWYRPRSAKDAYNELQAHLKKLRDYHSNTKKNKKKRRIFRKLQYSTNSETDEDDEKPQKRRRNKHYFNVFGHKNKTKKNEKENQLQFMKRILKMDVILTAWDFDSTTLAQQLTMIEKDLFLKITSVELAILVWQQSSKNAPNFGAVIAFAHRISCLVTTEVLQNPSEQMRAKMIARFVNVAYKCHCISNYNTCRNVLYGLQSPGVYRLKKTWGYVRKKHATKYQLFEYLSRLYRDPRLLSYQKAFSLSSQNVPYLPFIGDIIARLLDRVPDYHMDRFFRGDLNPKTTSADITRQCETVLKNSKMAPNLLTKVLMALKIWNEPDDKISEGNGKSLQEITKKCWSYKGLCDYYKSLDKYEDNRKKCLIETTEFLKQGQLSAINYNFSQNNLALDYLLKAKYKEDKENFYHSFTVEPINNI